MQRICKSKTSPISDHYRVPLDSRSHSLMETESCDDSTTTLSGVSRYLIVRPENGGIIDLVRGFAGGHEAAAMKFVEYRSDDGDFLGPREAAAALRDHRWVILVSVIARKLIAVFRKPMEWTGYLVEFLLNLFSLNGTLLGLLYNLLHGKVVIPERGSETFISAIGHLDGRIDLYKTRPDFDNVVDGEQGLMDLCIMAAKLAYENVNVVRNIVVHHWKMHFVNFYDGWNEFQKQYSTQVFILCDKEKDPNLILISFRGTEPFDADDWSTDFDYSWYEFPKIGKVHMGFLEALGLGQRGRSSSDSNGGINAAGPTFLQVQADHHHLGRARKQDRSAYYVVLGELKRLLMEHQGAKWVVTGHSLGGALAILFPAVLLLHEEEEVMGRLLGVYTFGQPRVGNRQLGKFMEAHLDNPIQRYFRVVYCNDLVPRLPYDDHTFLYKHFGVCLYYNSCYVRQKVDEEPNRNYFGMRYLIPEYLNAVWELMRSLAMGYMQGPEYRETWLSIFLRMIGLLLPGVSAHSPTNYVNSVRLGKECVPGMPF